MPTVIQGQGQSNMQIQNAYDFTGGLNLNSDLFKIAENETPDCLNVDFDREGGFRKRKAVAEWHTTDHATGNAKSFILHKTTGSTHLLMHVGNKLYYSSGANFTECTTALTDSMAGPMRGVSYENKTYIVRYADYTGRTWNGSTLTTMTDPSPASWDATYGSGAGTKLPLARCIAVHQDRLWVAWTNENSTDYPNRIRFSHPGDGGSWKSDDYIDIDAEHEGDEITAIVPMSDHMVVFKHHSVHAVYGYDENTFRVVTLVRGIGTHSQEAVAVAEDGVYFWHMHDGVYRYGARQWAQGTGPFDYLFDKLKNATRTGEVNMSYYTEIMLGIVNRDLWVAYPQGTDTTRSHVFRLHRDTASRRGVGAWTVYDLAVGPFALWEASTGPQWVSDSLGNDRVIKLDAVAGGTDDFGATTAHIDSWYVTGWFDAGLPVDKKRWRRPYMVFRGGVNNEFNIEVYHDYDYSTPKKALTVAQSAGSDALTWGVDNWGAGVWGRGDDDYSEVKRSATLGTAVAVALRVKQKTAFDADWECSGITFKYKQRRIKG